jgi:hypothetical protein
VLSEGRELLFVYATRAGFTLCRFSDGEGVDSVLPVPSRLGRAYTVILLKRNIHTVAFLLTLWRKKLCKKIKRFLLIIKIT